MHVLFANTGVQIVCVPLPAGRRYSAAQIGNGWQHCRLTHPVGDSPEAERDPTPVIPYVQWQILQGPISKLMLAVDTTLGDPHSGHFADAASMAGDFVLGIGGLVGASGEALAGIPRIELCLRAATATAGEAKPVHVIVDFGNSRTGALLLEVAGEVTQSFQMQPFELLNRYALDAWDNAGQPIGTPADRWFSSRTHWCNTPYRTPPELSRKSYHTEMVKGLLGSKEVLREYETRVKPELFRDFSQARLGREGDHVTQLMTCNGDFRTGLSSPKRYLWADDSSWLEGAFWYMADPYDRCASGTRAAKLQGPLLAWLHEDDRDFLLDPDAPAEDQMAPQAPVRPRHAPRTMMVVALYELLCQTYAYANSLKYRSRTTDSARAREIRSLTMTFPTGMLQVERERFRMQAEKAMQLFNRTLGRQQKVALKLTFSIDEASAVHLTYIWSELQMLGQDAGLWFSLLGRRPDAEPAQATKRFAPQAAGGSAQHATKSFETSHQALRIACIDIGGGSTDLMIAEYRYQPGIDDSIEGRILHRDGIAIAGDQLIKRLLEKVVIPSFADTIGFEAEDVQLLFGPEVPNNRGMAPQRIDWMNRLFLPLAEAYLQLAVDGSKDVELSHTDPQRVDPAVVETLEQACVKLRGPGYYNVKQDLRLTYDSARLEEAVHEVFDDLLFDICSRIVDHQADVVLLAGQPTKLAYMQDLVRRYVPLPDSRIVPMFQHYAGNWYPYQDVKGHSPGLIVDPKSAVVVGAAIEFLARHGLLPQFRFNMRGADTNNSYYWGVMSESTGRIRPERLLFEPASDSTRGDGMDFTTIAQRTLIGRKMAGHEDAQANPVYLLKMEVGDRIGPTEVTVRIRRERADDEKEEHLELETVRGTVAGEPAVLGENVHFQWRTLGNDRFFLDTGGLDNIELPQRLKVAAMAFKFLDTHDVVEALQQQEDTARQRFQHLCDQFHDVLRRLPEPEANTAADSPPSASATIDAQAEVAQPSALPPAPPAEEISLQQPPARGSHFDPAEWGPVVLGPQLAGDPALAASCQTLVAGLIAGDARAMKMAGQLLLFRSAPAERYPQLLKDLGEAYYGWRTAGADDGRFEAALVAWLIETCAAGGVANSIERVEPGDRFDPVRHQAPQTGVEVSEVHGWVVLRDNGKVYTRAAVTAR